MVSNQSVKDPHKATHIRQGEATSQHRHSHRGQQTLRREVTQDWGAVNGTRDTPVLVLACATRSISTPLQWRAKN